MSYYEEKSLQEVCGGGKCLKPKTIFDKVKNESPEMVEKIKKRGDLMLARQMPGPRDLDGRVGEIKGDYSPYFISTKHFRVDETNTSNLSEYRLVRFSETYFTSFSSNKHFSLLSTNGLHSFRQS